MAQWARLRCLEEVRRVAELVGAARTPQWRGAAAEATDDRLTSLLMALGSVEEDLVALAPLLEALSEARQRAGT